MNITFDVSALGSHKGDVLLALIVRSASVTPPAGWTQIESTLGASSLFLDAFARMVDDAEPALAVFVGENEEVQGCLVVLRGGAPALIRESSAHAATIADATPDTPTISSLQAINLVFGVWSAAGALTLTAPAGFTTLDAFTTSVIEPRSILFAYKVVGATGAAIAQSAATSSGAATGRAFALVLRDGLPVTPAEVFDTVPGNIGLLGRDLRPAREIPFGA